jgi:hypothetical protein
MNSRTRHAPDFSGASRIVGGQPGPRYFLLEIG